MITHKTMTITPAVAQKLLEQNTGNFRGVQWSKVDKWVTAMKAGEWQENGDTICIGYDGILIDGQHRLHAVIKSGITIRCIVVTGLAPESAKTKDTGKPRALNDWVRHSGQKNAAAITAIGRLCMAYKAGLWGANTNYQSRLTDNQVLDFVTSHDEALQGTMLLVSPCRDIIVTSMLGSIMMIACEDKNPATNELCTWFCKALHTGSGLGATEPVLHLRNRLNVPKHKKDVPYIQRMMASLVWNRTVRGNPMTLLKYNLTGPNAQKPIDTLELAPW